MNRITTLLIRVKSISLFRHMDATGKKTVTKIVENNRIMVVKENVYAQ